MATILRVIHSTAFTFALARFPFGTLVSKYDRHPMFMVMLVIFLFGLAFWNFSLNVTSTTFARIISGIDLGGELPVASTLVQERSPKKPPGKVIGLLVSTWAVGCMLAVVMAFSAPLRIGWRNTFFICRSPVLYGIAIRLYIPESPKWLASADRYDEAVAIVESIERAHGLEQNDPKTRLETGDTAAVAAAPRLPESHIKHIVMLFQRQFRVRTIVLWALWFVIFMSYAIFILLSTLITRLLVFSAKAHGRACGNDLCTRNNRDPSTCHTRTAHRPSITGRALLDTVAGGEDEQVGCVGESEQSAGDEPGDGYV